MWEMAMKDAKYPPKYFDKKHEKKTWKEMNKTMVVPHDMSQP
jgi:hypothetical protein